ncbi:MAG TPA: DUF6441 family protein [Pyrinomonadaceae bacterium]|nr:DUF6441 family protein [Pyrinomonadaceae bacterium]
MKIVQRPPSAAILEKNLRFGVAKGLTDTAKDGQAAVIDAIKSTFTTRGTWYQQNMRHGIKIMPAKRDKLVAEVRTLADWLEKHEKGGTHTGKGGRLSVPTPQFRPRGSTKKIPTAMRVRKLLASGKAFIVDTKKGPVVAVTKGRGKSARLEFVYGLEQSVTIKKQSVFFEPIDKVVKRKLDDNIRRGIDHALRTMRT